MEYEEIAKQYMVAKLQELQDQNAWAEWMLNFAIKNKREQKPEIKAWATGLKERLKADKANLESEKIAQEDKLTQDIAKLEKVKLD